MKTLDKAGGIAALYIAASYIAGFGIFLGLIDRSAYAGPSGAVSLVVDHQSLLSIAIALLYPLAATALAVLVVAIYQRSLTAKASANASKVAAIFGAIWAGLLFASGFVGLVGMQSIVSLAADEPATAQSAWLAVSIVQNALGGGIELVGGLWMALVSWIALKAGQIPRVLAWIGIAIGAVGISTLIPALGALVDLFGLGQIVWFAWLGATFLRRVA